MLELKVKIKDDELTVTEDYLIYEELPMSHESPVLKELVNKTLTKFHGDQSQADITIKVKMVW